MKTLKLKKSTPQQANVHLQLVQLMIDNENDLPTKTAIRNALNAYSNYCGHGVETENIDAIELKKSIDHATKKITFSHTPAQVEETLSPQNIIADYIIADPMLTTDNFIVVTAAIEAMQKYADQQITSLQEENKRLREALNKYQALHKLAISHMTKSSYKMYMTELRDKPEL